MKRLKSTASGSTLTNTYIFYLTLIPMTTVLAIRQQAIKNGEATFNTGRACRKGHMSDRYSSNGICIQCTKENNTNTRLALQQATTRANLINQHHLVSTKVSVQQKHQQVLEDLTDIMIEGGQRADELASFILLIGSSTLQRDDVLRYLSLDDEGVARNPTRTGESGKYEVQLRGEWYVLADVFEVKAGKRFAVHRVTPPLQMPDDLTRMHGAA